MGPVRTPCPQARDRPRQLAGGGEADHLHHNRAGCRGRGDNRGRLISPPSSSFGEETRSFFPWKLKELDDDGRVAAAATASMDVAPIDLICC